MEKISGFIGEYEFLNNDYTCKVQDPSGLEYTNVTSAIIAMRTDDLGCRRKFTRINGNKARKKESSIPLTNIFYKKDKNKYLHNLILDKFTRNQDLKEKLLATGEAELINSVTYSDRIYGVQYGEGKNLLGKILMQVRDEIK